MSETVTVTEDPADSQLKEVRQKMKQDYRNKAGTPPKTSSVNPSQQHVKTDDDKVDAVTSSEKETLNQSGTRVKHSLKGVAGDNATMKEAEAIVHKGKVGITGNKELKVEQGGLQNNTKVAGDATIMAVQGDICAKDGASVDIETKGAFGNTVVDGKLTVIGTEGKLDL